MRRTTERTQLWIVALVLGLAAPALAVEVRQIDEPVLFSSDMRRAYAPCTAPNDVTGDGHPACAPPVTSACPLSSAHVTIAGSSIVTLEFSRKFGTVSDLCRNGEYRLVVHGRSTFDVLDDDVDCPSGRCTAVDVTETSLPFTMPLAFNTASPSLRLVRTDESFQVRGVTLIAPDGLPIAAATPGEAPEGSTYQNLDVGYAECTSPVPGYDACDAAWNSPCDFTAGTVQMRSTAVPGFDVVVHDLTGTSPLCTNGTYELETRARLTLDACGPTHDAPCTLPDASYFSTLAVSGSELSAVAGFAGVNASTITSAEILGFRLFDPTGALFAAAAVTPADTLERTSVTFKEDRLRVRALFPPDPAPFDRIDPTSDDGATFTFHDRNGVIHTVTLPGPLWQLQPPLGERWEYKDPGGINAGVRKIKIKLLEKKGIPIGYDVRIAADDVDLSGADLGTVTFTIGIGFGEPVFFDGLKTAQTTVACRVKGKKKLCE